MSEDSITSQADAVDRLQRFNGRTIIAAETAREIAAQFDVELPETVGALQPIAHLDRFQPDNEALGIGCGSLCEVLAEEIDGIEAESFVAGGHGTTQDGLKDRNLPTLEAYVSGETDD